jgi:hypothetical protein
MRFRLRTLLIVLALGPPVMAGAWWAAHQTYDSRALAPLIPVIIVEVFVVGYAMALIWLHSRGPVEEAPPRNHP